MKTAIDDTSCIADGCFYITDDRTRFASEFGAARLLPLPLGEVAEQCEDGEGENDHIKR